MAPTLALAQRSGVHVNWHAISLGPLKPPQAPAPDEDRGAQHRRLRAELLARDIERYAPHPLPDIYRSFDCTFAAMGLLWVKRSAPAKAGRYVQQLFARYWRDGDRVDSMADVRWVIAELGESGAEFADFAAGAGAAELVATTDAALRARGVSGTPTYFIADEPYVGRQHLPLIERRLLAVKA